MCVIVLCACARHCVHRCSRNDWSSDN